MIDNDKYSNLANTDHVMLLHSEKESSLTNVILQYKLLASILSAVCSVIQHS